MALKVRRFWVSVGGRGEKRTAWMGTRICATIQGSIFGSKIGASLKEKGIFDVFPTKTLSNTLI